MRNLKFRLTLLSAGALCMEVSAAPCAAAQIRGAGHKIAAR
jgi:hypothetical protein